MMKEIRLFAGNNERNKVEMFARLNQDSIVVLLQGGEKPHIGAVVLTIPYSCSADRTRVSCNSWILPVLSHRDDEIARSCAEKIALMTGKTTAVIAGIHVDNASPAEVSRFVKHCKLLVNKFLYKYYKMQKKI